MRLLVLLTLVCLGLLSTTQAGLQKRPLQFAEASMLKHEAIPQASLCPTCVNFASQAISNLLNIILNAGVLSGCSELCGILAKDTGSQSLGEICTVVCDVAGFEAFTNLINKADLDPIYYCQLLQICSIKDNADAKVTGVNVTPTMGTQGTKFMFVANYTTVNGTGPGEIVITVDTVDKMPLETALVKDAASAGNYSITATINATPDPSCDPTTSFCEEWLPGNYTIHCFVCNGECGSLHPHSKILAIGNVTFALNAGSEQHLQV